MSARSLSRGRSRTRSPGLSPRTDRSPSGSFRRSISPRSVSRHRTPSRSPSPPGRRNGYRGRSRSRSMPRNREYSRSPGRTRGGRWPRDRSYTRSPSPRSPPRRSSKIVVEKLTKNVTEDHLYEIFGSFGEIQSLDLPMNRAFMTNRGTAYISYYDVADAEAAISHMHEAQLDGAVLKVSIVLPRRTFSRSPPPARHTGIEGSRSVHGREALNSGRQPSGTFRASPPRRRSPRRYGTGRAMDRHDLYRPRSLSRSRSPRRSRSWSMSVSPPPRRRDSPRRDSPRRRRRRSPSYSSYSSVDSYSSYSERSRSPSRSRAYRAGGGRR
ncbi:hypothetical protein VTN77DRAFT_8529 [Rasamsonia byssochlamydoides]|uniref:uncharacterized protein n=1 Tax=Rasamsonia byssochlamydoides TaxID=89139 RepID=UPI0037435C34